MCAKAVIIGGDASGMSAAAQIRRVDPTVEVVVFETGSFQTYQLWQDIREESTVKIFTEIYRNCGDLVNICCNI